MNAARRRLLIAGLALAALALAWFAPPREPVVQATARATAGGSAAAQLPPLREWPVRRVWDPLPARDAPVVPMREGEANAAGRAAAAAAAAAAARPATPDLPFRYLGTLESEGSAAVFLTAGNDTLSVRPGSALPGGWRLDAVLPGRLDFTFVPTESRQSLTIPAP